MIYCDLSRLRKAAGSASWADPDGSRSVETPVSDNEHQACISPDGPTEAWTKPYVGQYQTMFLCTLEKVCSTFIHVLASVDHILQVFKKKYRILPDLGPNLLKHHWTPKYWRHKLLESEKAEVDFYQMLDHTLVHEARSPFCMILEISH
jgi:hypothetical protein